MLIETTELTLPHVGLGALSETALLALFATAQAHRLTQDTGLTLDQVVDADGCALYPGYFWLHLRVPAAQRLEQHRLWRRVSIGIDVRRFGVILDSTGVLGHVGDVSAPSEQWNLEQMPCMRAASMFVVDSRSGHARPSAPREGALAPLPSLTRSPAAVERFRTMRARGTFGREPWSFRLKAPVPYPILLGRDVAPGKNLMFATYVGVMEAVESQLLSVAGGWPPLPSSLLEYRSVLEREVFFFGHTGVGQTILADARARITRCSPDLHGAEREFVSAGIVETRFELYEAGSNSLLSVARARKLLAIPRACASLISDIERWLEPISCVAESI